MKKYAIGLLLLASAGTYYAADNMSKEVPGAAWTLEGHYKKFKNMIKSSDKSQYARIMKFFVATREDERQESFLTETMNRNDFEFALQLFDAMNDDFTTQEGGFYPLQRAIWAQNGTGRYIAGSMIHKNPSIINCVDATGCTPLIDAVTHQNHCIAREILRHNPTSIATRHNGFSALDLAKGMYDAALKGLCESRKKLNSDDKKQQKDSIKQFIQDNPQLTDKERDDLYEKHEALCQESGYNELHKEVQKQQLKFERAKKIYGMLKNAQPTSAMPMHATPKNDEKQRLQWVDPVVEGNLQALIRINEANLNEILLHNQKDAQSQQQKTQQQKKKKKKSGKKKKNGVSSGISDASSTTSSSSITDACGGRNVGDLLDALMSDNDKDVIGAIDDLGPDVVLTMMDAFAISNNPDKLKLHNALYGDMPDFNIDLNDRITKQPREEKKAPAKKK